MDPLPSESVQAPDATRFDRLAATYDQIVPFFGAVGEQLVEWVGVRPGQRILDLGAGRGAITLAVCRRLGPATDVVAGDVSTEMLAHLRAVRLSHVHVRFLDATAIDEPDDAFDTIFSAFVLHFLAARARALGEVARVLRAGGTFAMSVPGPERSEGWRCLYLQIVDEYRRRAQLPPRETVPVERWADLASAAGLRVAERVTVQIALPLESLDQHWRWLTAHSHRGLYDALDEPGRREFQERVLQSFGDEHPSGGMSLITDVDFYKMQAR
jgi:ubiquinone/menaquinone biosynthesis C-methylase UbiE